MAQTPGRGGSGLVMAGSLVVAPAAHAAIDQTAMDNAVFSAYMRASAKSEQDFVMHVAWSAELVDWRSKNGQASRDAMYAHRLAIGRHFHENNTIALDDLGAHEMPGAEGPVRRTMDMT